ncbi:hypothetical protein BT63DRAFT_233370 [Microthyrium microscopicum]|uniref:Uncharacterized protein n=1 Tax=Microthyrium microscopicum TaxID=703497 RepID=A0A6A6UGQ4_9PEZI|nr:hypothetical protein BT63DRAFT_233370 [Microthyrium microscopicum]
MITDIYSPPYNWYFDAPGGPFAGAYDMPRVAWRRIRKKVGLAASPQVGALATVLKDLRTTASAALTKHGLPSIIEAAVVSSIDLVALYDEDIYDAAEHAGLSAENLPGVEVWYLDFPDTLLTDMRYKRQPKHQDAAQIGFKVGVCDDYLSTAGCNQQRAEAGKTTRNFLTVHVTRQGLALESALRHSVDWTDVLYYQQHESYFEASLGVASLMAAKNDMSRKTAYWNDVEKFVGGYANRFSFINLTDVLMIGESAEFPDFKEHVVQTIMALGLSTQTSEPAVHLQKNGQSLFTASKGAAEMARRVLDAPYGCAWPDNERPPHCRR